MYAHFRYQDDKSVFKTYLSELRSVVVSIQLDIIDDTLTPLCVSGSQSPSISYHLVDVIKISPVIDTSTFEWQIMFTRMDFSRESIIIIDKEQAAARVSMLRLSKGRRI